MVAELPTPPDNNNTRLEKISDRQIIMIVQPVSNLIIRRPDLAAFQTHDHVRSQAVHEVAEIRGVAAGTTGAQIGVSVYLSAAVYVERQARRNRNSDLAPPPLASYRNY